MDVGDFGELSGWARMAGEQEACGICGNETGQQQQRADYERRSRERRPASQHSGDRICEVDAARRRVRSERSDVVKPSRAYKLRAVDVGVGYIDWLSDGRK